MTDFPGDVKRYSLSPKPIGSGGYAQVFEAIERETGERVALKRLHNSFSGDGVARMEREIKVMDALSGIPGVMRILDADPRSRWLVMPLADGDLRQLRVEMTDRDLAQMIRDLAPGLSRAHELGYVHRDLSPGNILRLRDDSWAVADWGVVRRALGDTTRSLTQAYLGTDGYVAPEVLRDPHGLASPASDVYGLGRVIVWAATGEVPLAGERLHPAGPWRSWAKKATHDDPAQRPSLHDLVLMLGDVLQDPSTVARGFDELLAAAIVGDAEAGLFLLEDGDADAEPRPEFYFDTLPQLPASIFDALVEDEALAERIATRLRDLLADGRAWGYRDFNWYRDVLGVFHEICLAASRGARFGLLEDVADLLFTANYRLDQWPERDRTRRWLEELEGAAAEAVGRALRRHPETRDWLTERWSPSRGHPVILGALSRNRR